MYYKLINADVKNDQFYINAYKYYLHKGHFNVICSQIFYILEIVFMLIIFIIFRLYFNYSTESDEFTDYVKRVNASFFDIMFILVFCIYIVGTCIHTHFQTKIFFKIKEHFHISLHILDKNLKEMEWENIVKKLCENPDTILDITNRIMRRDNYLIAMNNRRIFNISSPFLGISLLSTKTLEWLLRTSIFTFFFDNDGIKERYMDAHNYEQTVTECKRWIRGLAIISLLLSPFVWMYMFIFIILKYTHTIKTTSEFTNARKWSNSSLWSFREINELQHFFIKRMSKSYGPTLLYINSFENHTTTIVARFLSFIFGSVTTVLIYLSMLSIEFVFKKNILWWITIFVTLTILCRGCIPDPYTLTNPKDHLKIISKYTHFKPKTEEEDTLKELYEMFEIKPVYILREIISILLIPYVLWYHMEPKIEDITDFFINFTKRSRIGYICSYGTFERENDEHNTDEQITSKLESSISTFKENHISWISPNFGKFTNDSQINVNNDSQIDESKNLFTFDELEPDIQQKVNPSLLEETTLLYMENV